MRSVDRTTIHSVPIFTATVMAVMVGMAITADTVEINTTRHTETGFSAVMIRVISGTADTIIAGETTVTPAAGRSPGNG